ncbi:unnamed protein product, partial [Polarella glacialis]
ASRLSLGSVQDVGSPEDIHWGPSGFCPDAPEADCPPPEPDGGYLIRRSLGPGAVEATVAEATGGRDQLSTLDGQSPAEEDKETYFNAYGLLQEQMTMLQDKTRTRAYERAILGNAACFKDAVVLDVGCGTGVLSIFAAKAGARKVYAIEASDMASAAKMLV